MPTRVDRWMPQNESFIVKPVLVSHTINNEQTALGYARAKEGQLTTSA